MTPRLHHPNNINNTNLRNFGKCSNLIHQCRERICNEGHHPTNSSVVNILRWQGYATVATSPINSFTSANQIYFIDTFYPYYGCSRLMTLEESTKTSKTTPPTEGKAIPSLPTPIAQATGRFRAAVIQYCLPLYNAACHRSFLV